MPDYAYTARDATGQKISGTLSAATEREVLGILSGRSLFPVSVKATKAATATCAHLLAQRGELDLDRPAAHYWPEFAAGGKAGIPVRWLLSHRAGLPVIDNPIPLADLLERAGLDEDACEIIFEGADRGTPKEPPIPPRPIRASSS